MTAIPVRFSKVWIDTAAQVKPGEKIVARLTLTEAGVEQKGSKMKFDLWVGTSTDPPWL